MKLRKFLLFFLLATSVLSCKTIESINRSSVSIANKESDYTATIFVREYGSGTYEDVLGQVQRIAGQFNLMNLDQSGVFGEFNKFTIRLHALPDKMINSFVSKIYKVRNVISVKVEKEDEIKKYLKN